MRAVSFLVILLCATGSPFVGQAINNEDSARTIRALQQEWVVGQSRNDNGALNLIFDNALIYVEYGQLVSKGDYLARIKKEAPQVGMEPMSVHTFGTTAIVVANYRERQLERGQRILRPWCFVDTSGYKKHGWVLVAAPAAWLK